MTWNDFPYGFIAAFLATFSVSSLIAWALVR